MNEYRDIEDFVKGRLEEGVALSPPCLAEIERDQISKNKDSD